MRLSILSPVLAVAFASYAAAQDASDVLTLTASDFSSHVDNEPLILVEFFAPWLVMAYFIVQSVAENLA